MPSSSLPRANKLRARDRGALKPGQRRSRTPSSALATAAAVLDSAAGAAERNNNKKKRPAATPAGKKPRTAASKLPRVVKNSKEEQESEQLSSSSEDEESNIVGHWPLIAKDPHVERVVENLDSDAWVRDGWTVPPGVPRPRKPPQRLSIASAVPKFRSKPPPPAKSRSKKKVDEVKEVVAVAKVKKSKKLVVGGKAQDSEESDTALPSEPPEQNYAALHEDPDTVKFKGQRIKLDWNRLWLFLCSKGWRVHDVPILNASDLRTYLLPGFKTKDEGGKSGTDYFLSHEGVLGYLAARGTDTLEEFFAQEAAKKQGKQ